MLGWVTAILGGAAFFLFGFVNVLIDSLVPFDFWDLTLFLLGSVLLFLVGAIPGLWMVLTLAKQTD